MENPHLSPSDDASSAMAFAQTLVEDYAAKGGDVTSLFAAFVGVVVQENVRVGRDALIALDRFLERTASSRATS